MSRSGRVLVALGVPVVVMLAACGGGTSSSGLPTVGTTTAGGGGTPTPTVTSSSPWTPEQQAVLDRVDAYYAVVDDINGGAALDMTRLRSVATDGWAQKVGESSQVLKVSDKVIQLPDGGARRVVKHVKISGDSATEAQCLDQTGTLIIRKGTPQPSKSDLYKPVPLEVTLMKVGSTWLVSDIVVAKGTSC